MAQPFGLSNRVANTTLTLPLNPPSPPDYTYATENAFGNLTFMDPVAITAPPGVTNELFVVEQNGTIAVITNLTAPNRTLFLNIVSRVSGGLPPDERGLLGMAFHPGYATNRYFYLYYSTTATTAAGSGLHQRISRFQTNPSNPYQALSASETPLLTMWDQANNHNGGDLHFGPDRYLYVSTGDEGNANDTLNNSQILDKDFWAGILRLDVDGRPENLAPNPHPAIHAGTYSVPADNPYTTTTNWYGSNLVASAVRTEFYAIGLRNPWRMSFDQVTGRLYVGDVGQNSREEVDVITKGGNFGWAFREGFISGPKTAPPGAVAINPILDYSRGTSTSQGRSITGGIVYRGTRFPQLEGHYIFGDYVSGNIWTTFYDGTTATPKIRIAGDLNIAAFGVDPANGDVLLADQSEDTIKRLVVTSISQDPFPNTLEETGAFADLPSLTPHAGILPYDVNQPFWSDNAHKQRWFSVPDPAQFIRFRPTRPWSSPAGSVWIEHFELEMTNGVPESRRRLETRFLVRQATSSGIYGVTYRWDEAQTNAMLVPADGLDETLFIQDQGIIRTQVWHYPGRNECLQCHTLAGGLTLGFNTRQINRDFNYDGIVDNQLRALENAGYFSSLSPVENLHLLPKLAPLTDESYSLEYRARSYLNVNCGFCHVPGGGGLGSFDLRLGLTTPNTGLIDGTLLNDGGDPLNQVIVRGSIDHSMLLTRLASRGEDQMPPLASNLTDAEAVQLLSDWITNELPGYQTFSEWQLTHFGSTLVPEAQEKSDPDLDLDLNELEFLTGTDPNDTGDSWPTPIIQPHLLGVEISYQAIANRGFEVQSSTNSNAPYVWKALNLPQNSPFFGVSNRTVKMVTPTTNNPVNLYRVKIFRP
jgi:uncharacterized repeat protein (TIGR03806 family)